MNTVSEALSYIHGQAWHTKTPGLFRMRALLELLGNPQRGLKFVHVAGTNGKGSTSAMLSFILRAARYKTGLFTSPYIRVFNERMQIDGEAIDDSSLLRYARVIKSASDRLPEMPTVFEMITAIAFLYFSENNCEVVVLETGLGGRLDATNIIEGKELCVITSIGRDHTEQLGDTVVKIAHEKAGIITEGCNVCALYQGGDIFDVISGAASDKGAVLHAAFEAEVSLKRLDLNGITFDYACTEGEAFALSGVFMPFSGLYQLKNASVAIKSARILSRRFDKINNAALYDGLKNVKWQGRFELLSRKPVVIADGCHNMQGVSAFSESLKAHFPNKRAVIVAGILDSKFTKGDLFEAAEVLFSISKEIIAVTPDNPRAVPASSLARALSKQSFRGSAPVLNGGSVSSGISKALKIASNEDIICIIGSLYIIKEAQDYFKTKRLLRDFD